MIPVGYMRCLHCGTLYEASTFHYCAINPSYRYYYPPQPTPAPVPQGWQCPACGRVYAPHMQMCLMDHSKPSATTGTIPSLVPQRLSDTEENQQ